jgi:hypothetical protein
MDPYLVDYVKSGKAWLLIGAGPSIQRGYPTWQILAQSAANVARTEARGRSTIAMDRALTRHEYPEVFQATKDILGGPRLLEVLRAAFHPRPEANDSLYRLLARWPISVYLTTNYDNEIQSALANLGEAYVTYSNSPDHLALLMPDLQGAIVKLHGDLTSETGLVLTTSDYAAVETSPAWNAWRTKMTSVFQMTRMVVVGHSLTDTNIRQVLAAAKIGAGVVQPVCWIAPNVSPDDIRGYLEKFRIRVIPYEDHDGTHAGLLRLLQNVDEFVPPRTAISISAAIATISKPHSGANAGAAGFFVFNKFTKTQDYHQKRVDVVLAAIESVLPDLSRTQPFTISQALAEAGWPAGTPIAADFRTAIEHAAIERRVLLSAGSEFRIHPDAAATAAERRQQFDHTRQRFLQNLAMRIRRSYPSIDDADANTIAADIEASLVGYFQAGGLALVSTLFAERQASRVVPSSILKFITEASAQYPSLLKRQAFVDASVGCFARPDPADKDYLGRISQGFVGFHMLGTFGAAAAEKLDHAKETVWLIDSSAQISALAIAAPMYAAFAGTVAALRDLGVRLFTTEALFDETREHLWFANNVIGSHGAASAEVMAAALGRSPYRKSNVFLQGFTSWQAAGNPRDWGRYMSTIFGISTPNIETQRAALVSRGIEVVSFSDWRGFKQEHFEEREDCAAKICGLVDSDVHEHRIAPNQSKKYEKVVPEAEALIVVGHERDGSYNIARDVPAPKDSWFVSKTSVLNLLDRDGPRLTWQPDAFVQFASTLAPVPETAAAERAFEVLLLNVARSGVTLLDERVVENVFGGIIEEATLSMAEQKQAYRDIIAAKYGESPESVLARVGAANRPLAALQLANEVAANREAAAQAARAQLEAEQRRASEAERSLQEVEKFRAKMERKRVRGRAKAKKAKRRQQSKGKHDRQK